MEITQKSVIDMIGFDVDGRGTIEVRIAKLTYIDGKLVSREPHRQMLDAGDDIDAVMTNVSDHLEQMGSGPIDAEGMTVLKAVAAKRWTKERIATTRTLREAEAVAAKKIEDARIEEEQAAAAAQADAAAAAAQAQKDAIDAAVTAAVAEALAKPSSP